MLHRLHLASRLRIVFLLPHHPLQGSQQCEIVLAILTYSVGLTAVIRLNLIKPTRNPCAMSGITSAPCAMACCGVDNTTTHLDRRPPSLHQARHALRSQRALDHCPPKRRHLLTPVGRLYVCQALCSKVGLVVCYRAPCREVVGLTNAVEQGLFVGSDTPLPRTQHTVMIVDALWMDTCIMTWCRTDT